MIFRRTLPVLNTQPISTKQKHQQLNSQLSSFDSQTESTRRCTLCRSIFSYCYRQESKCRHNKNHTVPVVDNTVSKMSSRLVGQNRRVV